MFKTLLQQISVKWIQENEKKKKKDKRQTFYQIVKEILLIKVRYVKKLNKFMSKKWKSEK